MEEPIRDGGGGGVTSGLKSSRSLKKGIRAGVGDAEEAGKGHVSVSGNGRTKMLEDQRSPGGGQREVLDVPELLDDHTVLNGFAESFCPEEEKEEKVAMGGGVGGGSSSPAIVQGPQGEKEVEILDDGSGGEDVADGGAVATDTKTCLHTHQKCCCSTAAAAGLLALNLPNGHLDSTAGLLGHRPAFKVANGGLLIGGATIDWASDCPDWDHAIDAEPGAVKDFSSSVSGQDEVPPCPDSCVSASSQGNPSTTASSAKLPPPLLDRNSPGSEPHSDGEEEEEEEEEVSELSLPMRPQTLRTNPNVPVSLSCDATPLTPDEETGFYFGDEDCRGGALEAAAGRRQSAPDNLSQQTDGTESKPLPKRFGIADFFTRSLFSRKTKEPKTATHNATGWRLFGKTREDQTTDSGSTSPTQQEEQLKDASVSPSSSSPQHSLSAARRKKLEFEPLSTTALILEDRPSNLPAKSEEETQRHKQEYEEMVAGAKKKELKEAQRKKRQMKERHRQEDSISNAMVVWNNEILPNWDTMKGTRRVRDLWWQGLPPSVRGRVWSLAIGNELNITPELYEIFLCRAREKWRSYSETSSVNNDSESDGGTSLADRESSLDLIKLDISRTFPSLFIFQKGGPYHDLLHSVLGAYTCYRPDIGYVQGMSFIAAVLILNLEEAEAFITFANLLNKPCQMSFFRVDHDLMLKYFAAFEVFFEENLPRLFSHFQTNSLTPDLYLIDWIFTLFSKSLPLDVACRVWDVFCRDGEESLFRTGLGILRLYEDVLLQMDFIHIAQFLTRLPDDLQPHTLFNSMANTHMISRNRRWAQVFSSLTKEANKETDKNNSPALRS